jgi:hypothetical protein
LFSDRWKTPLPGGGRPGQSPSSPQPLRGQGARPGAAGVVYSRHSNGLDQFFSHIKGEFGLNLLDLSGASQANIGFITNLGHRLYSEDLLQTLEFAFGHGDFAANQCIPERQEAFFRQTLVFPENHFDGALIWDVLEFLAPPVLKIAVERLSLIVKPGSYLFAIFHAEEHAEAADCYSYRIADAATMLVTPRGIRRPAQFFNNRSVEKLFQAFESVKFFLTRDHLREVIVKR